MNIRITRAMHLLGVPGYVSQALVGKVVPVDDPNNELDAFPFCIVTRRRY